MKAVSIANSTDPAVAVLKPFLLSEDEKTAGILLQLPRAVQQIARSSWTKLRLHLGRIKLPTRFI